MKPQGREHFLGLLVGRKAVVLPRLKALGNIYQCMKTGRLPAERLILETKRFENIAEATALINEDSFEALIRCAALELIEHQPPTPKPNGSLHHVDTPPQTPAQRRKVPHKRPIIGESGNDP